jgi:hypothetical protein
MIDFDIPDTTNIDVAALAVATKLVELTLRLQDYERNRDLYLAEFANRVRVIQQHLAYGGDPLTEEILKNLAHPEKLPR